MRFHLSILYLRAWGTGVLFRMLYPIPMSSRLFPTLFSIIIGVSSFTLRPLIHLNLSFLQGHRYGFICTIPHTDIQLDKHHFLWNPFLFSLYGFPFFVNNTKSMAVSVYFWDFNSFSLIALSGPISMPCSFYYYCFVSWNKGWEYLQKFFYY